MLAVLRSAPIPILLVAPARRRWLYRALVLLVVACPCALVISTPVSIVSALAGAARQGVLDQGRRASSNGLPVSRVVAFDKTGTADHADDVRLARPNRSTASSRMSLLAWPPRSSRSPSIPIAARHRRRETARAESRFRSQPACVRCRASASREDVDGARGVRHAAPICERRPRSSAAGRPSRRVMTQGMSPVVVTRDGEVIGVIGVSDRREGATPRRWRTFARRA